MEPNTKKSIDISLNWLSVVVLALSLIMLWLLVIVNIDLVDTEKNLEYNRRVWLENNIRNYEIIVRFRGTYFVDLHLEIENNQVVRITNLGSILIDSVPHNIPIDDTPEWYTINYSHYLPASLNDYDFLSLFDYIETVTETRDVFSTCFHSPLENYRTNFNFQYGYVEDITYSYCNDWNIGLGLICPQTSACNTGFIVTDFVNNE